MPEELFNEILSVSWGLLLEWDYQLTASACKCNNSKIFKFAFVKIEWKE